MGFRFRKSIKLAPGLRLNLTKKGISSLSIGKRGAAVNIGKKGTRGTVGLPGSGLSYSVYQAHKDSKRQAQRTQNNGTANPLPHQPLPLIQSTADTPRQVSVWLGLGILLLPIIFAWFTLRQGYSTVSRVVSMVWMVMFLFTLR